MEDFFTYDRKTLEARARFPLTVLETEQEVFKTIADDMLRTIQENNEQRETTVFIVPVGPVGQYPFFVEAVNTMKLSLKDTYFINMDEYLDDGDAYLPKDHRLSFRGFMDREVYQKIDPALVMDPSQRVFPDPQDPQAVDALIQSLGKVDVCYGGIGITGHIAFNEPEDVDIGTFASRPSRVLTISQETRTINSVGDLNGAIYAMPKRCVTIGMQQILFSSRIVLGCFRSWHRAVVRQTLCQPPNALFPATLLQNHRCASLFIPASVAQPAYKPVPGTGYPKYTETTEKLHFRHL